MDPDACLSDIRAALVAMDSALDELDQAVAGVLLAELVRALDEWMSKGGFLPIQWQRLRGQGAVSE